MVEVSSIAEHSDTLVVLLGVSMGVVAWFLRGSYNSLKESNKSLAEKMDRMENCLLEVKKGYVKRDDCSTTRTECKGYGRECTDRIIRVLERLEKNVERNHSLIFYLCDSLIKKNVINGDDLEKLRDKSELGK